MRELRQNQAYAEYMQRIGWSVERSKGVYAYVKRLPLIPLSVMKVQRVKVGDIDFSWLKEVVKKHRVVTSYIELLQEPDEVPIVDLMRSHGYQPTRSPMLPTQTLVIDVTLSEEELQDRMKKKTRYNIGKAQRNGLKVEVQDGAEVLSDSDLMKRFTTLLHQNARRVGMLALPEVWLEDKLKAFGADAVIALVWNREKEELLAAALFLVADETIYYQENGSIDEGRRLQAPTLAVWSGMVEAKRRKLKRLDFDGIYDERFHLKRWRGFSRFKKGFGDHVLTYPPAFRRFLPARP